MTDKRPLVTKPAPPLDSAAVAGLLAATAATVVAEVRALGREAGWRPQAGEWSANECVGHLIEAERRGFAGRIRTILDAVHADVPFYPDLESWDPPAVAKARRDDARDPADLTDEFSALRDDSLRLVRSLRAEDLTLHGMHPEVGRLRVDELLGEWVHHDRNHVRQILSVTQARVWDQMGNAQRFSLEEVE